jgi:hypothetical protein
MNVTRWNSDFIGAVGAEGGRQSASDGTDDADPRPFPTRSASTCAAQAPR